VLVYDVSPAPMTPAPIRVIRVGSDGGDAFRIGQCAPAYAATMDIGRGKRSSFSDPTSGLRVDLLSASGSGYRLSVAFGQAGSAVAAPPAAHRRGGRRSIPHV
jgi:hypothetical protein